MSNDLWSTPPEVFHALDLEFGFGFDVCAEYETAKCPDYWTIEDDALSMSWAKDALSRIPGAGLIELGAIWCNPPYSNITPWVEKAIEAQAKGRMTVMLVMCDPSVKWFSLAQKYASEIRFITNGRIAFLKNGVPQKGNNKGSVIFVFDPHRICGGHVSFIERDTLLAKGAIDNKEQAA
jgi:phage N-6-adenine-methyltransferase